MRGYILVLAGLSAVALAAGAFPAFSADGGTVQGTVTTAAPPAPCLTVSPTSVDFGTLAFSTAAGDSTSMRGIDVANCGTARQQTTVAGTNASGPAGLWRLMLATCPSPDGYVLQYYGTADVTGYLGTVPDYISSVIGRTPVEWTSGESKNLVIELHMPCEGSNGAGEQKTFSFTFTAVVA